MGSRKGNYNESNFKVCGLCSRLVDESVQLNRALRAFVIEFLCVENKDLPNKVCAECYTSTTTTKRFKEGADRAMAKLKAKGLSDNMVLGKSPNDKKEIKAMAQYMPKPGNQMFSKYGITDAITVNIPPVEKNLAEKALYEGGPIKYGKRKAGLVTPNRKNPPAKMAKSSGGRRSVPRKGYYDESNDDEIAVVDPPLPRKSRASENKSKKDYYYVNETGEEIAENNAESEEIFPSIGPYQCEICQQITDTKVDFVKHIKRNHIHVVDDDILRSLEEDLRKAQNRSERADTAPLKLKVPATKGKSPAPKKKPAAVLAKEREQRRLQAEKKKQNLAKKKEMAAKKRAERAAKRKDSLETANTESSTANTGSSLTAISTNDDCSTLEGEVTIEEDDDSKNYNWKSNVAKKYEQETETTKDEVEENKGVEAESTNGNEISKTDVVQNDDQTESDPLQQSSNSETTTANEANASETPNHVEESQSQAQNILESGEVPSETKDTTSDHPWIQESTPTIDATNDSRKDSSPSKTYEPNSNSESTPTNNTHLESFQQNGQNQVQHQDQAQSQEEYREVFF